jgi:hypothetical protein
MDVQIEEVHSSVDVVDHDALLTPEILARIVAAVRASLADEHRRKADRAEDVDFRSVIDQQRDGRR